MIPWNVINKRATLVGAAVFFAFFICVGLALAGWHLAGVVLGFTIILMFAAWFLIAPKERPGYREPRHSGNPFSGPTTVTR